MEEFVLEVFNIIAFVIGIIGVAILSFGVIKGLWLFILKRSFWTIRVNLVEHILLGLDFLIARDIIETVTLKQNSMLWMDLIALVLIVVIRVVFSFFTGKEMEELLKEHKKKQV